jgi:hypothetical protein
MSKAPSNAITDGSAASKVEVLTKAQAAALDLRAHSTTINETLDLIVKFEDSFEESTLEPRLLIGLEIAKAQEKFGMTKAEAGAVGGSKSQCDMLSDPAAASVGFSGWLAREIPRLKRPTAIKYAHAFASLGIPAASATPAQIRAKIKDIRHHCGKNKLPMPSLHSLYKAGKPKPLELTNSEEPEDPTRLGDAREAWFLWREKAEKLVNRGVLDDLDKPGLEALREFNLWMRDRITVRLKTL